MCGPSQTRAANGVWGEKEGAGCNLAKRTVSEDGEWAYAQAKAQAEKGQKAD